MRTQKIIFTVLLFLLAMGVIYAQTYDYPLYQSGHDIAEWNMRGGHIASGAYTPSGTASEGALFYDITTSTQPLLYRYTSGAWAIAGGSGGGSGDTATITQAINDNATAIATNTDDISALDASLTEHIETQIDPHGATMTVTQSETIGTGTADASIAWVNPGTLLISSYTQIPYEAVEPSGISSDSVTLWANPASNTLQVYNGSEWLDVGGSSGSGGSSALVEQYHNVDTINPAMVEDFGARWAIVYTETAPTDIYTVECLGDGIVLAGTGVSCTIIRSTDDGTTWGVATSTSSGVVQDIKYLGGGIVLAGQGSQAQIWRSTDYGTTWGLASETGDGSGDIQSIEYLGGGVCLAGKSTDGIIWRSTDYGTTWGLASDTDETYIKGITYLGGGIVLAGTYPNGLILRSTDYGVTWGIASDTALSQIMAGAYLGNGIAIMVGAQGDDNSLMVRTDDYGVTWSEITCGLEGSGDDVRSIAYLGNGTVIAGSSTDASLIKSADYGLTWGLVASFKFGGELTHIEDISVTRNGESFFGTFIDDGNNAYAGSIYKTKW